MYFKPVMEIPNAMQVSKAAQAKYLIQLIMYKSQRKSQTQSH